VSARETYKFKKNASENHLLKIKKTESKEFGIFDFLYEESENDHETENDLNGNLPNQIISSQLIKNYFFYRKESAKSFYSPKRLNNFKTTIYITYRNLRL
jgi:hypothetical protein